MIAIGRVVEISLLKKSMIAPRALRQKLVTTTVGIADEYDRLAVRAQKRMAEMDKENNS
jgi:hypothetical protein